MRVRREPEQLRALGPQLQDLRDRRVVVGCAAVVAAVHEHAPGLFPERAIIRIGEERLDARARVGDRPLALLAAAFRALRHAVAHALGQPGKIGLLFEVDHAFIFVLEHVLAESREQPGEFLVDLRRALLARRIQPGAGTHEVRVVHPGQSLLLGGESRRFARLVDPGDALEQLGVLRDLVAECSQFRRHLAFDGLHGFVVQRRAVDAIDRADAIERAAGTFHRCDRVLEGRCGRVVRDAIDFGELLGHAGFESRLQVAHLDLVERRHAAVRADPGRKQGGYGVGGGLHVGSVRHGGEQRKGASGGQQGLHRRVGPREVGVVPGTGPQGYLTEVATPTRAGDRFTANRARFSAQQAQLQVWRATGNMHAGPGAGTRGPRAL